MNVADTESRREALARRIADQQAAEHLAMRKARLARERQKLRDAGLTDAEIDRAEELRRGCEQVVLTAMAFCRRVWVESGTLRVDGSRRDEFKRRLAPYNEIHEPHPRSLAAIVFSRLEAAK